MRPRPVAGTAHQTPALAVALIRWLRQEHGLPAWGIAMGLRMPRSTVSAWLRRLGLNRPAPAPTVPVQRYEWPATGDLLHVDIKPLGRIGQIGHRIHGDRRRASPGIGWEYVHVAVDDHSRIAYVEVLADQLGPTCLTNSYHRCPRFGVWGLSHFPLLVLPFPPPSHGDDEKQTGAQQGIRSRLWNVRRWRVSTEGIQEYVIVGLSPVMHSDT